LTAPSPTPRKKYAGAGERGDQRCHGDDGAGGDEPFVVGEGAVQIVEADGQGELGRSLSTMRGHRKSSQAPMKAKIATTATVPFTEGSAIRRNRCQTLAPST